jgi:hypothetical protein
MGGATGVLFQVASPADLLDFSAIDGEAYIALLSQEMFAK